MNCSTPGFPVLHYLPKFAQTHVHWVGDAIQQSHPLLLPSSPALISQHHGYFQWVSSSHQVAKVLELQFQHQSFQWIFRVDFLYLSRFFYFVEVGALKKPADGGGGRVGWWWQSLCWACAVLIPAACWRVGVRGLLCMPVTLMGVPRWWSGKESSGDTGESGFDLCCLCC